jgi:hypothetical protein
VGARLQPCPSFALSFAKDNFPFLSPKVFNVYAKSLNTTSYMMYVKNGRGSLKMPTCRPEINEDLVRKIKIAYPQETAMLGVAETVEWAMKKLLEKEKKRNE